MTESVNIRLQGPLLQQARELAAITDSTLQDVLLDWLNFSLSEQPLESLTDGQLLENGHLYSADAFDCSQYLFLLSIRLISFSNLIPLMYFICFCRSYPSYT